jgi:hypothetical protein
MSIGLSLGPEQIPTDSLAKLDGAHITETEHTDNTATNVQTRFLKTSSRCRLLHRLRTSLNLHSPQRVLRINRREVLFGEARRTNATPIRAECQ